MNKVDIDNPASYKNCIKKKADYFVCKPPKGTLVIDKLSQHELLVYLRQFIPALKTRCYLTADEIVEIGKSNSQLYNYLMQNCFVVNDTSNMVLCGTEGELWLTNYDYVCNNYLIYSQNGFVNIQSVIGSKVIDYNNEKVMDWCRVTNKATGGKKFACFVPVSQKGVVQTVQGVVQKYNISGVEHGKGDFIICDNINGKPDFRNRWVVNGLVFSNTYDNRGWSDKITIGRMGIAEPVKLWVSNNISDTKSLSLRDYLLGWFKKYNIHNFYDFILNNNLKDNMLKNIKLMVDIATYLMQEYNFSDFSSNEDKLTLSDFDYCSIYGTRDALNVTVYCPNSLCGWNYEDEDGEFADDPYEIDCKSISDIDDFMNTLMSSITTHKLLQKLFKSIDGTQNILRQINDFDDNMISLLNQHKFSYKVLHTFLINLIKAKKAYSSQDMDIDYDWETRLTFTFSIDSVENCVNFVYTLDDNIVDAFYCDTDDESYEVTLAYNDYEGIKEFLNNVKTGKYYKDETCLVDKLDLPVNTVAFNNETVYTSFKGKVYSSDVGDFSLFLREICQRLDSVDNFTSIIDIGDIRANNVTELPKEEFIDKFFSRLDNSVRVCVYNQCKDDTNTKDLEIAYFEVLNITRTKRVYGRIVYQNGFEMYVNVSKSTLKLLEYEHPNQVKTSLGGSKPNVKFIALHYYQLMLRMGCLSSMYNIKRFKLEYMNYNKSIFEDKLSHTTIVTVGNYDRIHDRSFDDTPAIAHNVFGYSIVFNGHYMSLQDDLSPYSKAVLVHEMCHSYVKLIYGTCAELDGEDGGTYMHLAEWCKNQWWCHGKRFAEAVKLASDRSEFTFYDIFGCGLGHSDLLKDNVGKNTVALCSRNAFNCGQSYRNCSLLNIESSILCKRHGVINCKCGGNDKVTISAGRYIGMCRRCGEVVVYDDNSISSLLSVSPEYFDVVDRIGVVATSKCNSCGGSIMPIVSNSTMPKDKMRLYLSDLSYANRYVDHLYDVCNSNKDKYENYFSRTYNCMIEVSRGRLPYLCIDIFNNHGFKEMYKLFVSCSATGRLMGKLYRDYDLNMKGRLIHTFRINSDREILKFFDYTMSYIRRDLSSI